MPMKPIIGGPKQQEQARLLYRKALDDIALVKAVVDSDEVTDEIVGFHCQQAAEKLLKAVLSSAGALVRKTHDLESLMAALRAAGETEPRGFESLDSLTPFATVYRYESYGSDTGFDRHGALELLLEIQTWCNGRLEELAFRESPSKDTGTLPPAPQLP